MSKHEKLISHLISITKLNAYKITLQSGNVHTKMWIAYKGQIVKNRNFVKALIDLHCIYLARQGVPFWSHDECKKLFNQG